MATIKRPYLVAVEWEDAAMDDNPDVSTAIAQTVGWLLYKDKKTIRLASERFDDGNLRQVTAIPRKNVRKIIKLVLEGVVGEKHD